VIESFNQLDHLIFNFGFNSYLKISKLILYYFYKSMILVFCEIWMTVLCGFTGSQYFESTYISFYTIMQVNILCFVAIYHEKGCG
jgi:phospholipid-transporting ATPase